MTKRENKMANRPTARRRGFVLRKHNLKSPFASRVFEMVRRIPAGETLTYREVATFAGSPGAARAVGNILKQNFNPAIPCHRVIRSDGRIGDYNRSGPKAKLKLLCSEGCNL